MKVCRDCKKNKPITEFGIDRCRSDGHNPYCKKCICIRTNTYKKSHPDKIKAYAKLYGQTEKEKERKRIYRAKNRDKCLMATRQWQAQHAEEERSRLKSWYQNNKERAKNSGKEWVKHNRDKRRIIEKTWQQRHPEKYISVQLKNKYGISYDEYNVMLKGQDGVCRICKQLGTRKMLDVDHDHKTGKVRGLLCNRCNQGLGLFRDNTNFLDTAKLYLMESN